MIDYGCDNKDFLLDKEHRKIDYIQYMLLRSKTMFDWQGLPPTIPARILEQLLQLGGNACIFSLEGKIYATFGGLGGILDYNYEPTLYTIANPYLNYSAELEIGKDCIRMRNDDMGKGLLPMYHRYAGMMVENDISIMLSSINSRMTRGIVADNDTAYESAKNFVSRIIEGKLAPMMSEEFFEGVHALEHSASTEKITDLIEAQQYLKASWYNEIGLNSNYNMKRERIAAPEAQLTDDALLPLVDMMLETRRRGCDEVNEMFGTDWKVDFAGAWLREHLKQQVQGMDFDSDGNPEVDEEVKEDPTEEPEEMEENGENRDSNDIDPADDSGDDTDFADNDTGAAGNDNDIDITVTVNNNSDGDNTDAEIEEGGENDDEGETETAN